MNWAVEVTQLEAFSGKEAVAGHEVLVGWLQIIAFNFETPLVEVDWIFRLALAAGNDRQI